MVERDNGIVEVVGSNPIASTTVRRICSLSMNPFTYALPAAVLFVALPSLASEHPTLDAAFAEARKSGKLVLLYKTCGH